MSEFTTSERIVIDGVPAVFALDVLALLGAGFANASDHVVNTIGMAGIAAELATFALAVVVRWWERS